MNRPGVSPLAQGSSRRERSGGRGEVGIEASTRFITWHVIEPIRCLTIFTIVPHATEHPIIVLDEREALHKQRRNPGERHASRVYKEGTAPVAPRHVEGD